jgi:hypothetical protein
MAGVARRTRPRPLHDAMVAGASYVTPRLFTPRNVNFVLISVLRLSPKLAFISSAIRRLGLWIAEDVSPHAAAERTGTR